MPQVKNVSLSPRLDRQMDRRRQLPRARVLALVFDLYTQACDRETPYMTPDEWALCTEAWDSILFPRRPDKAPVAPRFDLVTPAALANFLSGVAPETAAKIAAWTSMQAIAAFDHACLRHRSVHAENIPRALAEGRALSATEADYARRHELEPDGYEPHVRHRNGQRDAPVLPKSSQTRTDVSPDDLAYAHAAGITEQPAINIRAAAIQARAKGQWPRTDTSPPIALPWYCLEFQRVRRFGGAPRRKDDE